MLQAFVALKNQQPPRTESGLQSFFDSLAAAAYSDATYFCTNVDATPTPFSVDAISQACLDPKVKFAIVRGESPHYWQATVLMPDKKGLAAMFVELESEGVIDAPPIDTVTEFASALYKKLEPRLIRIGDSEAREKLKSRHGLVLMPGLGRVEWLQIVHPDVYSELYNPSELVAAPAFQTDIWEDGALYLRVYGDPKDWDNEENISLANFIPGFLAGTANVKDGEKEKQNVRTIEKLWNRASKTAERAAGIFTPPAAGAAPAAKPAASKPAVEPEPVAVSKPAVEPEPVAVEPEPVAVEPEPVAVEPEPVAVEPEPVAVEPEPVAVEPEPVAVEPEAIEPEAIEPEPVEAEPEPLEAEPLEVEPVDEVEPVEPPDADVIAGRLADAGEVEVKDGSVEHVETRFSQPIYSATDAESDSTVYLAWHEDDSAVRLLDKLEDFAAFLQSESFNVQDDERDDIVDTVKTYHRPYLVYIDGIGAVPEPAASDPRLADFDDQVKAPWLDVADETQQLHIWAYNPRNASLEEILIRQFNDWPLTMEVKRHLLDLKAPASAEPEPEPEKVETRPSSTRDTEPAGKTTTAASTTTADDDDVKSGGAPWGLIIVLIILAVLAVLFFTVFEGDVSKLTGG